MKIKLLTSAAIVALLATPALAEDTMKQEQPAHTQMAPDQATPSDSTAAPMDQAAPMDKPADSMTPAPDSSAATPAPDATDQTAATVAPSGQNVTFINQQDVDQWMASNLIGSTVYNSADESLGDINDVLLTENGQVEAVVIGIGGFLGIGEKNVAITFDQIQKTTDADGNPKLVLNASKEQLDQAPAFVTQAQIEQEKAASQPASGDLTPAPAPEPAPAN
jgi:sporulation protein YlmC with PRC-barrel domain